MASAWRRLWLLQQYTAQVKRISFRAFASTTAVHQPVELSYVKGSTATPLSEATIGEHWDGIVSKYGDRVGLVSKHENNLRWSFREFDEHVSQLGRALYASGLRKGDRLGVYMLNNSAWMTLQYATAKMGIILVTINPGYKVKELEDALNLVGCKALVTVPEFKTSKYLEMIKELIPNIDAVPPNEIVSERLPDLKQVIFVDNKTLDMKSLPKGVTLYEELYHSGSAFSSVEDPIRKVGSSLHNRDIINIQFTSGTTGKPKGVSLSHRNILNNGISIGDRMRLTEVDSICLPVPLFHCFGLVLGSLAAITHGASIVLPSQGFEPEAALRAVQEEKCTALHGVPTMFITEMNHPSFDRYDLSSLRTGISAGSPAPIEVMKDVMTRMHMKEITICYGMTETSPVTFQSETTDGIRERCETVGRVLDHVEAKVIDPSTNEMLPRGVPGELLTRGYPVMEGGYWNSKAQTDEAIDADGWMHTGDAASIDEQGYCRIVGRIKDLIIRGGENIHPLEVENLLFQHTDIENVSVVGVPDKVYGEQVCAWIIPKRHAKTPNVQDIQAFCTDKIAKHKIPKYVLIPDDLEEGFPKTGSGKIMKHVLRAKSRAKLGLD
ncbi:hypothetical protein BZG36_02031 [Bifiguratus adelaidae]|uniref:Acyl-CoA synthetase YngI n=1 Tax=Bifiguratus adelaidae TaxID=1938954 RepID=A0A261Y1V8_9FUNG|nr:hypothetical protein BZG36_02031 [Bifiguratus adelaidae]